MKERGYHFSRIHLSYDMENTKIYPGLGVGVTPNKEIGLCRYGLHASYTIYEAFPYALGTFLSEVELEGEVIIGEDKMVGRKRKIVRIADFSRKVFPFYLFLLENLLNTGRVSWGLNEILNKERYIVDVLRHALETKTVAKIDFSTIYAYRIKEDPSPMVLTLNYLLSCLELTQQKDGPVFLFGVQKLLKFYNDNIFGDNRVFLDSELGRLANECYWFDSKEEFLERYGV